MIGSIRILIKSNANISVFERLEDKIRYILEQEGLKDEIILYGFIKENAAVARNM